MSSTNGGYLVSTSKVNGVTNCFADGVKATRTLGPALMRVRTKSGTLYAAMSPVTTTVKFNHLSMVSYTFLLLYFHVIMTTEVDLISSIIGSMLLSILDGLLYILSYV